MQLFNYITEEKNIIYISIISYIPILFPFPFSAPVKFASQMFFHAKIFHEEVFLLSLALHFQLTIDFFAEIDFTFLTSKSLSFQNFLSFPFGFHMYIYSSSPSFVVPSGVKFLQSPMRNSCFPTKFNPWVAVINPQHHTITCLPGGQRVNSKCIKTLSPCVSIVMNDSRVLTDFIAQVFSLGFPYTLYFHH